MPATSYADALRAWRAALDEAGCPQRLPAERVSLLEAGGRVPARAVRTLRPCPTYRAAAMDGVALRAGATVDATPSTPVRLSLGVDATRVDTGAVIASAFDAVERVEAVAFEGGDVVIDAPVAPGQHVRLPGDDVPPGVVVGWPGHPLRPVEIGALLASGIDSIEVVRRPRVSIVATGNEIVPPGSDPQPGTVIESNASMIAAHVRALGGVPLVVGPIRDEPAQLERVLRDAADDADVVLVIAGSSRGGRDKSAAAIERVGTIVVRGVATRPGRPVALGRIGAVPVVNLPGYPVACDATFAGYAAELIARLGGVPYEPWHAAVLDALVTSDGGADEWRPAVASSSWRTLAQGSDVGGSLYRLALADARMWIERGHGAYPAGARIGFQMLRGGGFDRRPLFVGPYDPVVEELAATCGFRCDWSRDETGAALRGGVADAVGVIAPGRGPVADSSVSALREEGFATGHGTVLPTDAERPVGGFDPWQGAARVVAGLVPFAWSSAHVAHSFGLSFAPRRRVRYAIVPATRGGARFVAAARLGKFFSTYGEKASRYGWSDIDV